MTKKLRGVFLSLGVVAGLAAPAVAYIDVCNTERVGNCTKQVCHKFQGERVVRLDDGTYAVVYYGYPGTVTVTYC